MKKPNIKLFAFGYNFVSVIYMHKGEPVPWTNGTVWIVGLVELFYLGVNISFKGSVNISNIYPCKLFYFGKKRTYN